jgi:hypothetical protein
MLQTGRNLPFNALRTVRVLFVLLAQEVLNLEDLLGQRQLTYDPGLSLRFATPPSPMAHSHTQQGG